MNLFSIEEETEAQRETGLKFTISKEHGWDMGVGRACHRVTTSLGSSLSSWVLIQERTWQPWREVNLLVLPSKRSLLSSSRNDSFQEQGYTPGCPQPMAEHGGELEPGHFCPK